MRERTDANPREDAMLDRASDRHREPTFPMKIRRANEQQGGQLRKDSLAIREEGKE